MFSFEVNNVNLTFVNSLSRLQLTSVVLLVIICYCGKVSLNDLYGVFCRSPIQLHVIEKGSLPFTTFPSGMEAGALDDVEIKEEGTESVNPRCVFFWKWKLHRSNKVKPVRLESVDEVVIVRKGLFKAEEPNENHRKLTVQLVRLEDSIDPEVKKYLKNKHRSLDLQSVLPQGGDTAAEVKIKYESIDLATLTEETIADGSDIRFPSLDSILDPWEKGYKRLTISENSVNPSLSTEFQDSKLSIRMRRKRLHKCKVCLEKFSLRVKLKAHMQTHPHDNPLECNICQKTFSRKSTLNEHFLIHTGEKPYQCPVCQTRFTHKSTFNTHKLIHSGTKPHKCNICPKAFTQKSNLNTHMVVHTGERPHLCPFCQKKFTVKSNLNVHLTIHNRADPPKCKICRKSFSRKSTLKAHMLIHTGEKPYHCPVCQRAFTFKPNLTAHLSLHTNGKSHLSEVVQTQRNFKESYVC